MVHPDSVELLSVCLRGLDSDRFQCSRLLALYAATVATADSACMRLAVGVSAAGGVPRQALYEVVLQSYLFLGFPRMLLAAEQLEHVLPRQDASADTRPINEDEASRWFERGLILYNQVYGDKAAVLRHKVEGMAPEVFRWMIIEGYGKVLSRAGLSIVDRELAIVSFLMMENREQQLVSHMNGAVNVGAPAELLETVVHDIGEAAGEGYRTALSVMRRMGLGS